MMPNAASAQRARRSISPGAFLFNYLHRYRRTIADGFLYGYICGHALGETNRCTQTKWFYIRINAILWRISRPRVFRLNNWRPVYLCSACVVVMVMRANLRRFKCGNASVCVMVMRSHYRRCNTEGRAGCALVAKSMCFVCASGHSEAMGSDCENFIFLPEDDLWCIHTHAYESADKRTSTDDNDSDEVHE